MFPQLPSTYVDHLVAPQGIGDVPNAHAAGEVGSMVGGFGVRMSATFANDGDRVVLDAAAGRAFGSQAPLPAISWLSEHVRGLTAEEAQAVSPEDVIHGLTEANRYELTDRAALGTRMVVQALRRALGDADAGAPADPTGTGILVCRCLGVGDREIRAAIQGGAHDPEAIGLASRACTGCRSCRTDLLALIDEELNAPVRVDPTRDPIERITLARAGTVLRGLGVEMTDASLEGPLVRITLGSFAQRPSTTTIGAVAITRHVLRETVWDGAFVELDGDPDA